METRNWSAWVNLQPPGPRRLIVQGEAWVGTPTSKAILSVKVPSGVNPRILLLNLIIEPHGGPDVMTWVNARYDKVLGSAEAAPLNVEIFAGGKSIANLDVKEVQ